VVVPDGSTIFVRGRRIVVRQANFDRSVTLVATGRRGRVILRGHNIRLGAADPQGLLIHAGGTVRNRGRQLNATGIIDSDRNVVFRSDGAVITGAVRGARLQVTGKGLILRPLVLECRARLLE
jgi:hypothetical protein